MDDPEPTLLSPRRAVVDERIRQRAGGVSGAGVDDEAGRLVDDEQVLVLVRDAELRRSTTAAATTASRSGTSNAISSPSCTR